VRAGVEPLAPDLAGQLDALGPATTSGGGSGGRESEDGQGDEGGVPVSHEAAVAAVEEDEREAANASSPRWLALPPSRAALLGPQAFRVTQLLPGASYIFRRRVRNQFGWSPFSLASPVITTFPCLPVQQPEVLKCGPYCVWLRWNEQGRDGRFMGMTNLEFDVQVGKIPAGETQQTYAVPWETADASVAGGDFGKPRAGDAANAKFVAVMVNNLSPATDHCVRVRVRTVLGWSTWSEVSATFRTLAAPC